ncbi:DUF3429 domain-containing protein [Lentibacter algarum]|uniref:DUF3429 domain-containing protein n=1 Tax=Lentibacter algarum TaxID=576131 RepID=UPI0023A87180|nr:DUF3429 domain-containing protein [Lentibacter algarum]
MSAAPRRIPRAPLVLGLAGLLPFLWGALTAHFGSFGTEAFLGERLIGLAALISYGTVILCFMSGILWGFSMQLTGAVATRGYIFSVLPALWAFFCVGGEASLLALMAGFAALLALDFWFVRTGAAPVWWMSLRVLLTSVVLACLLLGLLI